jgi:hypothetical protein
MVWILHAQERAQMSAPAPEAENEYSKGPSRPRGRAKPRPGAFRLGAWAVAGLGVLGAVLLLGAEFAPLYVVHVSSYGARPSSVSAGAHNAYALVPIAVLAAVLALAGARRASHPALWALSALGLIAVLIAMIGDLPDTRARGITHGLAFASTTAGSGLYLETLGGVLLVAAGGLGLLSRLSTRRGPRRGGPRTRASRQPGGPLDRRRAGESAS